MPKRRRRDRAQMDIVDCDNAVKARQSPRRSHQSQFAAQSVGSKIDAKLRCVCEGRIRNLNLEKPLTRRRDAPAEPGIRLVPFCSEGGRVALEHVATANHIDAGGEILGGLDFD